ncbi:hypothetical protein Q0M94_10815 [Deinococcus radiomollis]|uniref:hypothetical protein n=1 Tax=Deinococcus radiomollis TaxID=468916 RepID=UPI0038918879
MKVRLFSPQREATKVFAAEQKQRAIERTVEFFGDDSEYCQPPRASRTRQKRVRRESKIRPGLMKRRPSYVLTYEALSSAPGVLLGSTSPQPKVSLDQAAEVLALQSAERPTQYDNTQTLRDEVHFKVLCAFSDYEKTGEWPALSTGLDCEGDYCEDEEVFVSTQQWLALLTLFPTLVHRLATAVDMHAHQRLESTRLQLIQLTVALRRERYLNYLNQRVLAPRARPVIAQPIHVRPRPPTAPTAPPA